MRPEGDMTVPGSIPAAVESLRASVAVLREARNLLPADPIAVRLVVDTNALIDCPDLTVYAGQLGQCPGSPGRPSRPRSASP